MVELKDRHNPAWLLLPVNNDRTAWRPFGLPALLIVPQRRDPVGKPRQNSQVQCVKLYVEDVPVDASVSGHDNRAATSRPDGCGRDRNEGDGEFSQIRHPDRELYAEYVSAVELADKTVPMASLTYYRPGPGGALDLSNPLEYSEAAEGDYFAYTARGRVDQSRTPQEAIVPQAADYVPYLPDADYYDFSSVTVDVELLPPARYNLVYQAEYFTRQRTARGTGELLCIDVTKTSLAVLRFPFNHPGEVMEEFHRHTPQPFLTDKSKGRDATIALYRPLTDAIQDVYDEQSLLEKVNWVYDAPNEAIPYLASILGWDLPYYPDSLDNLRRTVLRNTSYLQESKGSRQAISELFRLLGFEILISNLWWSADGKTLIRPNQRLGSEYSGQEVSLASKPQYEPVLADYRPGPADRFNEFEVPLLYRPQTQGGLDGFAAPRDAGDVYLDAYVVEIGSEAHDTISAAVAGMLDDPGGYAAANQTSPIRHQRVYKASRLEVASEHLQQRTVVNQSMLNYEDERDGSVSVSLPKSGLIGYSQIRVSNGQAQGVAAGPLGFGLSEVYLKGQSDPPLSKSSVELARDRNALKFSLADVDCFGDYDAPPRRIQKAIYVIASYTRQEMVVPQVIEHLQSNRFDIQLLQVESDPPLAGQRAYIDVNVLDFAFEFLDKVRAFHSLLNVMRLVVELTETYSVGDVCVGGDVQQRPDSQMGQLQVPPAIIPKPLGDNECEVLDPERRGYKREDIIYRLRKLSNLPEEHQAYKDLELPWTNRLGVESRRDDQEVYSVTGPRIRPADPAAGREDCKFTAGGQDRILVQARSEAKGAEYGPGPNSNQSAAGSLAGASASPVDAADLGSFPTTGPDVTTAGDSSQYGAMTRERTEVYEPECETDGVTDYCYKGRVEDELLYRPTLLGKESYRNGVGPTSFGRGVYWTYNSLAREFLTGVKLPHNRSRTGKYLLTGGSTLHLEPGYDQNVTAAEKAQHRYLNSPYDVKMPRDKDTFLGRLYQAYGRPETQSLHYTDRSRVSHLQSDNLALQRPELDVQVTSTHFPGCRFLSMAGLPSDHVSPDWRAKPWDSKHSGSCGVVGACVGTPGWLNARLTVGEDGDEWLEYDDAPHSVDGNGLAADVPSMGGHAGGVDPQSVVHSVRSAAPAGHPAITLQSVEAVAHDAVPVADPLFQSHQDCGDGPVDFPDGHPYSVGEVGSGGQPAGRNGASFDASPATAVYFLGDGVLVGRGMRLDGGTLLAGECGTGEGDQLPSWLDAHRDQDGTYDWNQDRAWMLPRLVADESYGCGNFTMDGSIASCFELLPECPDNPLAKLAGDVSPKCYTGE